MVNIKQNLKQNLNNENVNKSKNSIIMSLGEFMRGLDFIDYVEEKEAERLKSGVESNITNVDNAIEPIDTYEQQQPQSPITQKQVILTEQEQQTQNKPYYDNFNNNVNNITELTDINGDNVKVAIDEVNHLVDGNQWTQRTQQGLNLRHNVLNNISNLFSGAKKSNRINRSLNDQLNSVEKQIRSKVALLKNNSASAINVNNNVKVFDDNTHMINSQLKKEIENLEYKKQKLINKLKKGVVNYSYYTNDIGNGYSVRFDVENMQDGTKQLYNFNVIDNNTGDVFNQEEEINKTTTEEQQPIKTQETTATPPIKKPKGQIKFVNNGLDRKTVITLFKDADISTLFHEVMGHHFLRVMEDFAEDGFKQAKDNINIIKEWTGAKGFDSKKNKFNKYGQEKFARGVELYIMTRQSLGNNSNIETIFESARRVLKNIYKDAVKFAKGNGTSSHPEVQLNKDITNFFNKYLMGIVEKEQAIKEFDDYKDVLNRDIKELSESDIVKINDLKVLNNLLETAKAEGLDDLIENIEKQIKEVGEANEQTEEYRNDIKTLKEKAKEFFTNIKTNQN